MELKAGQIVITKDDQPWRVHIYDGKTIFTYKNGWMPYDKFPYMKTDERKDEYTIKEVWGPRIEGGAFFIGSILEDKERIKKFGLLLWKEKDDKTGVQLIEKERARQVNEEGYAPSDDDRWINGELANAASCYAATPGNKTVSVNKFWGISYDRAHRWPFSMNVWKPTPNDRIKELTKAGALIAAEIDRLKRL